MSEVKRYEFAKNSGKVGLGLLLVSLAFGANLDTFMSYLRPGSKKIVQSMGPDVLQKISKNPDGMELELARRTNDALHGVVNAKGEPIGQNHRKVKPHQYIEDLY